MNTLEACKILSKNCQLLGKYCQKTWGRWRSSFSSPHPFYSPITVPSLFYFTYSFNTLLPYARRAGSARGCVMSLSCFGARYRPIDLPSVSVESSAKMTASRKSWRRPNIYVVATFIKFGADASHGSRI